jgi:hypothetical protein
MPAPFRPQDPARFEAALRRFDQENSADPNRELINGLPQPRELVYAQWLTDWVLKLRPEASEELRLAARSQHLQRWIVPRDSYPMTRPGYLKWRHDLKQIHARCAGDILRELGYPPATVTRVQSLIRKELFPQDPESRVLEDALCLVFLERQLAPLAARSTRDKMIGALRKSWKKMSPAGHAAALKLDYTPELKSLIEAALGEGA